MDGFYDISTIIGYLMPNPLYTYILDIYDLVGLGFMGYQAFGILCLHAKKCNNIVGTTLKETIWLSRLPIPAPNMILSLTRYFLFGLILVTAP